MASPSFELDDQSDDDFFDKLVNDELDFAGSSTPTVLAEGHGVEVANANAIASLSISGVEEPDRVEFVPKDSNSGERDDLGEKANLDSLNSLLVEEEIKSNGVLESETGKVKLVQWATFGSESPTNLYGSYSDLFGGLGESFDDPDPFSNLGKGETVEIQPSLDNVSLVKSSLGDLGSSNKENPQEDQQNSGKSQDFNSSQYWENAYPGWKLDPSTGQWCQLEGYDANVSSNGDLNSSENLQESSNLSNSKQESDSIHSEQNNANAFVAENVSDWNQGSDGSTQYPAHMVFDPQYPGWYYDTISQEWKSLDSYNPGSDHTQSVDNSQQFVNRNVSSYGLENHQDDAGNWNSSLCGYNQQNESVWQSQESAQSVTIGYAGSQQLGNHYLAKNLGNNYGSQQTDLNQGYNGGFGISDRFQSVNNSGNLAQYQNQTEVNNKESQFNSQNEVLFPQQPMHDRGGPPFSYIGNEERKSSERPPHALVTFGFGGKLVVMKDTSSLYTNSAYGTQDSQGGVISVLNLMDVVVMAKNDTSGFEMGGRDYFNALCQQSFPGPLVGGNAGSKELNKWIDDKIANNENLYMDFGKGELLRLLFSLLKIAVQYYGKLRSPFGSDPGLKENDSPESAVAKLFASAKRIQESGNYMQCLQNIPSEAQIQATALEVQRLLVTGRKKEALELAQEGQLWGPALIIASQLGDQLYGDTVKKLALRQFMAGSPLRTLCLLIAGHPAEVFSDAVVSQSSASNSLNMLQQPAQAQANSTLDEWTQNLAIITANRTKDDELVIIHLGDSLWKDTGEITAAHICYLVAEVNFEQHSDSARLCLIGADHWKSPRTYASPEAIQRTELYEYAKVLGNSQFLLLPFQAYKLVYAHMLVEVGKISESLKYCQAILKSLKTSRAPELEAWKQLVLSLEERIKTHQQGGYGTNLAPIKLVGKLLTFFDSAAHRVVGGLPPHIPSASQGNAQLSEHPQKLGVPRVSSHQSTFSQSPTTTRFLMPSASMEPISASVNDGLTMPHRSNSEPDFSRSPRKADSSNNENSNTQGKTPRASGSRFGRFGSQLFQKTVGLVIKSGQDKQAKLGEANSFYYDEKLKRWVERGAEPPLIQEALPPPPPTAAFHSTTQDYNTHSSFQPDRFNSFATQEIRSSSPTTENGPGVPPIPPGSNQFSARGRMGVRSRYVDTFNKGGGAAATNSFHSPPPTQVANKPIGVGNSNPKFFIPTPVISPDQIAQTKAGESWQETTIASRNSSASLKDESLSSMARIPTVTSTPTPTMQRFSSMDRIVSGTGDNMGKGRNISVPPQSRRTASWGGSLSDALSPSMYMSSNPPPQHLPRNIGSFGDDLHEVQL